MKPPELKREQEVDSLSFIETVIGYNQTERKIKKEFNIHQYQLDVLVVVHGFYEKATLPTKKEIQSLLSFQEKVRIQKTIRKAVDEGWIYKMEKNEKKIRQPAPQPDGVYGVTNKGLELIERLKELALFNSG